MDKMVKYLVITSLLVFFIAGFLSGFQYRKSSFKCPETDIDTTYMFDTIPHHIPSPYPVPSDPVIIIHNDTIPANVDTLAILQKYYNSYVYPPREWKDSSVYISVIDTISQNKVIGDHLTYKLLKPQTIIKNTIDNTVNYSSYLSFGIDVPVKNISYIELEMIYNWDKAYIGVGYTPELKSPNIKIGVPLLKFKKAKK